MERAVGAWWQTVGAPCSHDRAAEGERGLTLLELVVAMSVFAIIAGGVAGVVGSGLNLASNNRSRSIAANLASQEMDRVRQIPFTTLLLQYGTTTTSVPVGGVPYTVKRSLSWEAVNASTNICTSQSGLSGAQVLAVDVQVAWPSMGGVPVATAYSEITPPVGVTQGGNNATIPVTVDSNTGAGAENVAVTVTNGGSTTVSLQTDAHGCAYFVVPAGTYTVSLNTPDYVDRNGQPNPSQTFTLPPATNVPVQFDYDFAGSLALTLTAPNGGQPPDTLPLSAYYQYFPAPGVRAYPGSGASRTIAGLFPDSYVVWAGNCADSDPEGQDVGGSGRYWPTGQRPSPIAVARGTSASGTVVLATVDVTVVKGGAPVGGATVTAIHDDAAAPNACPVSGLQYTFGTTDASGHLQIAVPFGHGLVSVSSSVGSGVQSVAVDPSQGLYFPVTVVIP